MQDECLEKQKRIDQTLRLKILEHEATLRSLQEDLICL